MRNLWKRLVGADLVDVDTTGFTEHQLAAAALLVEAALMDGVIGPDESARVERLLAERFGLSAGEARMLYDHGRAAAERSVEWQGFTSTIKDAFDDRERVELVEMLWEVVLVDGELHDHEASLMRRITGLLYVDARDNADARRRALEKVERGRS
ncbi:MAG: TerB family tellurite resistance protein [Geminicoccaceae bacterium]|nr:TerB family tellurite resistance protein [Geminicoccaceae bacterium]